MKNKGLKKGKLKAGKSNGLSFFARNKILIIITSLIFLAGLGVAIYFIVKSTQSNSGSGSGNGNGDKPQPQPQPTISGKLVGSWVNASADPSTLNIKNQDLIMMASYTPNPWSVLYPCTNSFQMFQNDLTALTSLVSTYKTKASQVLLSIGGSSFGLIEWQNMLFKYTGNIKSNCECPGYSYWFPCNNTGTNCDGKIINMKTLDGATSCCNSGNNPHRCCCGSGNEIITDPDTGEQTCFPSINRPPCTYYGIIPGKEKTVGACMSDNTKNSYEKQKCLLQNTDPVLAYATLLYQTGADGIDFDFESPDPTGILASALVQFSTELKAYMMKTYNKQIYLSITILSGNSYDSLYGGIYKSLLTSTCPFDYAIPMLYNGGQYPYGDTPSQTTWNGLLDYWRLTFMKKGVSNTKLIAAFIEYAEGHTPFKCADLQDFLNEYIITPKQDGGIDVQGVVYFYSSTDYNIPLLNDNLTKSINCIKNNNCSFTC